MGCSLDTPESGAFIYGENADHEEAIMRNEVRSNTFTPRALRLAQSPTPQGEYRVDAEALRRARQGTPRGEYH